jgi:hypothetical protein
VSARGVEKGQTWSSSRNRNSREIRLFPCWSSEATPGDYSTSGGHWFEPQYRPPPESPANVGFLAHFENTVVGARLSARCQRTRPNGTESGLSQAGALRWLFDRRWPWIRDRHTLIKSSVPQLPLFAVAIANQIHRETREAGLGHGVPGTGRSSVKSSLPDRGLDPASVLARRKMSTIPASETPTSRTMGRSAYSWARVHRADHRRRLRRSRQPDSCPCG